MLPPLTASRPTSEPAASSPTRIATIGPFAPFTGRKLPRPPRTPASARRSTPFCSMPCGGKGLPSHPTPKSGRSSAACTLDLVGLPPTPRDVAAFLADTAPDAYERLVDRLLASPHYGERWGRHWLDVAGYADSEGYDEQDRVRPEAFRFRDYVIRSFNADKPFDQFVIEQLAGDELVPPAVQEPLPVGDRKARGHRLFADGGGRNGHRRRCPPRRQQPGRLRHDQDRLDVAVGPLGRLCSVPRSPLRPDPAGRLLPHAGRVRAGSQLEELARPRTAPRLALHRCRPRPRRRRQCRGQQGGHRLRREATQVHRPRTRQGAGEVRAAAGQTAQGGLRHARRPNARPNRNRC